MYVLVKDECHKDFFLAVYDGHGGSEAAAFAATHLHHILINNPLFVDDPLGAMRHAYRATDESFIARCRREVRIAKPRIIPVLSIASIYSLSSYL